jgi:hypothetical protein
VSSNQIEASALTTFQVDPDGAHVRLHVRDRSGSPASVVLPIDCLNQLMMTLPAMVQTAPVAIVHWASLATVPSPLPFVAGDSPFAGCGTGVAQ